MTVDVGSLLIGSLPRLRRFALGLSRSGEVADDLVQSACERALASRDSLTADVNFDAWMFRVLRNLWYDRLRRIRTRGEELDVNERPDLVCIESAESAENRAVLGKVAAAIDTLPDEQREVLLLICVEETTYSEAAEILEVPIGTIMSRLARARRRLTEATGLQRTDFA